MAEMPDVIIEKVEVAKLELKPGEIVVFFTDGKLSLEQIEGFKRHYKEIFPDNPIMILDSGLRLAVLGGISG